MLEASVAVRMLEDVATGRGADRTTARLTDIHSALAWVDAEVTYSASQGASPAVDSAAHLVEAGGKRVRPLALLLACSCFGPVTAEARELAVAAELVHLATLLHDDVIDDGSERRGVPTSRRLWGNAVSVLAGDLLLVHALDRARRASPGPGLAELLQTLHALVDGEVIQLRGRTQLDASRGTYDSIIRGKTASLFVWAMRAGARAGGAGDAEIDVMGRAGESLGFAFQIVDDVLDYEAEASRKTPFLDLHEGKVTMPLLLLLERRPEILGDVEAVRAGDPAAAQRLLAHVRANPVCEEARVVARAHVDEALSALSALPASPSKSRLLALVHGAVRREA